MKIKAVRDYFLHSAMNYSKAHPNRKTCNLLKAIFNVRNILLQLRTEFRERNS